MIDDITQDAIFAEPPKPKDQHPNLHARTELARQLHGDGVEFGPGCYPLPLGPFVRSIRYCDFFDRTQFLEQFPEAWEEIDGFPETIDIRLDFEKQPFVDIIGAQSLDFVVANHVLEHLVNPLGFLEQCYEVLKPDGMLFIGLPDKRMTFDRNRQRTLLGDLLTRYHEKATQLPEEKLVEFVNQVHHSTKAFGPDSPSYVEEIARLRRRSVHVNVWLVDDAIEIFQYLSRSLAMPWELMDGILWDEEFLLVFRKSTDPSVVERYPITLARFWHDSQALLLEKRYMTELRELKKLSVRLQHLLFVMDERMRETQGMVHQIKSLFRKVPGARLFNRLRRRKQ